MPMRTGVKQIVYKIVAPGSRLYILSIVVHKKINLTNTLAAGKRVGFIRFCDSLC